MPAKSKSQFRLMQAAAHSPKFAQKVGIKSSVAKEYTESNVGKKAYAKLPEKKASGGGLYANIHAKRERIAEGSGEKMRKPGSKGAPTAQAFRESAKTAKMKNGGPSLAVGRGEKLSVERGAGLTQKGREKYNRETGSNLKAPQPQGGPRRDSFCARMEPVAKKSERGSRARASMKRWNCPGW
jgi:hypothetical protein